MTQDTRTPHPRATAGIPFLVPFVRGARASSGDAIPRPRGFGAALSAGEPIKPKHPFERGSASFRIDASGTSQLPVSYAGRRIRTSDELLANIKVIDAPSRSSIRLNAVSSGKIKTNSL